MSGKVRIVILWMVLLVVQQAYSYQALAFMTFARFGGVIHAGILKDALSPLGVREGNLAIIRKGTDSQDIPFTRKFTCSPQNHCDDNTIRQGYEYWSDRVQQAVVDSGDAYKNRKSLQRCLFEFGEGMHTVQDFYSHSTYVEWLLQSHKALEPVDWNNVPPDVRTGYYYYGGPISNDFLCKRDKAILNLHQNNPSLQFRSADEYDRRAKSDSYVEALNYVLAPGDLLHRELNKDGPKTMEGRIVVPELGKTLHALARQIATADTARQWGNFEQLIRSRYGDKASLIIAALKGDSSAKE